MKGRGRDPFQGVTVLPHPFRKPRNVLVFATVKHHDIAYSRSHLQGEIAEQAKAAGATHVGGQELMDQVYIYNRLLTPSLMECHVMCRLSKGRLLLTCAWPPTRSCRSSSPSPASSSRKCPRQQKVGCNCHAQHVSYFSSVRLDHHKGRRE